MLLCLSHLHVVGMRIWERIVIVLAGKCIAAVRLKVLPAAAVAAVALVVVVLCDGFSRRSRRRQLFRQGIFRLFPLLRFLITSV